MNSDYETVSAYYRDNFMFYWHCVMYISIIIMQHLHTYIIYVRIIQPLISSKDELPWTHKYSIQYYMHVSMCVRACTAMQMCKKL